MLNKSLQTRAYVLKHIPQDFIVDEVANLQFEDTGRFLYFMLKKKDATTPYAISRIAQALKIQRRQISCAGNKDRRAVTSQICSIQGASKSHVESLNLENISLDFLGFGKSNSYLGNLEGNSFKITVRNIDKLPKHISKFKNLFGKQRFGKNNVAVGRAIIKGEFKEAVLLLKEVAPTLLRESLVQKQEWISALRAIQARELMIYMHAYQSFIWNEAAKLTSEGELEIVGFASDVTDEALKKVLNDEQITQRDFIVRQLPNLSCEGSVRKVFVNAKDFKMSSLQKDEFFEGKNKVVLEFFLPKGCYATVFIGQVFESQ